MFSRCPFFNRGNLEKISNYTRTIFLTVCKNNYDNRLLFRNVLVFSYENQVFCIKIRGKKRMSHNPPRKNFFSSQKTVRKNFSQGVMTHPWKKKYFFPFFTLNWWDFTFFTIVGTIKKKDLNNFIVLQKRPEQCGKCIFLIFPVFSTLL